MRLDRRAPGQLALAAGYAKDELKAMDQFYETPVVVYFDDERALSSAGSDQRPAIVGRGRFAATVTTPGPTAV